MCAAHLVTSSSCCAAVGANVPLQGTSGWTILGVIVVTGLMTLPVAILFGSNSLHGLNVFVFMSSI